MWIEVSGKVINLFFQSLCVHVCVGGSGASALRCSVRMLGIPNLEFQVVVCLMWVLGTEQGSVRGGHLLPAFTDCTQDKSMAYRLV